MGLTYSSVVDASLADAFSWHTGPGAIGPGTEPLTVAVTGSGGLIGTALTALLTTSGHQVIRLVRRLPRHAGERYWRPEDPGPELLDGIDAVIHLAGASIGGRFTPSPRSSPACSRPGSAWTCRSGCAPGTAAKPVPRRGRS
jgi:hypothetical protein